MRSALIGAILAFCAGASASNAYAQQAQELRDDLDTGPKDSIADSKPDTGDGEPSDQGSDLPADVWSRQIDAEWYLNFHAPLQSNDATGGFF